MRLTCPNCDAIYEVPVDAIPAEGRDVQCTNCGHSWFQAHPESELPAEVAAAPSARMPQDARRVLEEEAEREMAARAEERGRARRPRPAPVPIPRDPGFDADDDLDFDLDEDEPPAGEAAATAAAPVSGPASRRRRRDLLPDIEEINGSLKPATERRGGRKVHVAPEGETRARRKGFRLGLGLTVLAVAALVVLYVLAPDIAARVPAAAPVMEGYVGAVDGWRMALDGAAQGVSERLTGWVDSLASPEIEADVAPGEVMVEPDEIVVEDAPAD